MNAMRPDTYTPQDFDWQIPTEATTWKPRENISKYLS